MAEQQLPVFISAFGSPPRPGAAIIVEQTPGERTDRTLSRIGMFWALALGGAFIPVAYFFLLGGRVFYGRAFDCRRCHVNLRVECRPQ